MHVEINKTYYFCATLNTLNYVWRPNGHDGIIQIKPRKNY